MKLTNKPVYCKFCNREAKYVIFAKVDNPYVCSLHKKMVINMDISVMGIYKGENDASK